MLIFYLADNTASLLKQNKSINTAQQKQSLFLTRIIRNVNIVHER